MRYFKARLLLAAILVGFFPAGAEAHVVKIGARAAQAHQPCTHVYSVRDYRAYASRVYRRTSVSKAAHEKLAAMHVCQHGYRGRVAVGRFHASYKSERTIRRQTDAVTPFGAWAIPAYIVMCESHGSFTVVNTSNPNRPAGAYQIITGTWQGFGGGAWAQTADAAPPLAQHIVAGRIWRAHGSAPWACA